MRYLKSLWIIILLIPLISWGQNYQVHSSTFGNGAEIAENTEYKIKSTLGQPVIADIPTQKAGFWYMAKLYKEKGFTGFDFNRDGKIDVLDVQILSAHFGFDITDDLEKYDVNDDGNIDNIDVKEIIGNWGD
jgi:hypothetical protein